MKIELRVDRRSLRRWHIALADRLTRRPGVEVGFCLEAGSSGAERAAAALFQVESLLFGLRGRGDVERVEPEALARFSASGEPYLTIDLADAPSAGGARAWRVECDGVGLERGLLAATLARRAPVVRVLGPAGPLAIGRPGAEGVGLVKTCFAETLHRVGTLIEAALDGAALAGPPAFPGAAAAGYAPTDLAGGRWAARGARTLRGRAVRWAYRALCHSPHWRVGWRRLNGEGGWRELRDDGARFYADPFPVVWRGRTFLFVEEFEHRRGKGVVSAVEFGPDGPLGAPEPVLETPTHLSYPQVFEADGEMWMIPESVGAGAIELYRAADFPRGWVHERTLVPDVAASDPTLVPWRGRWWIFATVRDGGGSFSDTLWLWSAPDFRGPWTAHPRNPVLIDIGSARPAGRMFTRGGALYRPVQDCRGGYGSAMALARVDRLDDGGFSQSLESVLRPDSDWPGWRMHTLNEAGGLQFVDGSALAPRWSILRRPLQMARREPRLAPA